MKIVEGALQTPRNVERTTRLDRWRGLTSVRAGVINPVAFFPLLREDAISGRINVQIKMQETVKPLLNGVRVKVMAHLVPFTTAGGFWSLEQLNASYEKEADYAGSAPPPFIPVAAVPASSELYNKLGIHLKAGLMHSTYLVRAYNSLINARRKTRSELLPTRGQNDHRLAQAFWADPNRYEIVPDFDAPLLEGAVPLNGVLEVDGFGVRAAASGAITAGEVFRQGSRDVTYDKSIPTTSTNTGIRVKTPGTAIGSAYSDVTVDLGGGFVNIADMEAVRKTQAYARLREVYAGYNDDYIIDLLMDGISVPQASLYEPILLGSATGVFGMMERHATDYENLDKSLTTGMVSLSINVRTPPINPGGVVLVTCEIVPESLPELGVDPFLTILDQEEWPHSVRDELDPEKVEIVDNSEIDAYHSQPDGVFGYTRLNYRWMRDFARIGGKFIDGATPSVSEERYRIWQVRPTDPDLTDDFYLCPTPFPHDVFADTAADPFEVVTLGTMQIRGRTVIGPRLNENVGAFEDILSEVDFDRVADKVAGAVVSQQPAQPEGSSAAAAAAGDDLGKTSQNKEGE
ncbi:MAG: major capsid protein [Microvirus sp.]|nr:MAG: major capsid protein [Microvirus sp.]